MKRETRRKGSTIEKHRKDLAGSGSKNLECSSLAAYSSILAWGSPMDRGVWSMGSQRVGHDLVTKQQHKGMEIL